MDEAVTVKTVVLAVMFVQASIFIAQAAICRAIEQSAVGAVGLRMMTKRKEGEYWRTYSDEAPEGWKAEV